MKFPWQSETRAESYSDQVVAAIINKAGNGQSANAQTTAAVEISAGLWARAFASAEVMPDSARVDALTPAVLEMIGRQLILCGEVVFVIDVDAFGLRLTAAQTWNITGSSDPDTWMYECTLAGPSSSVTRKNVPAAQTIHARYSTRPLEPWKGIGPLQSASGTCQLMANLEAGLANEAGTPTGYVIPVPDNAEAEVLTAELTALKGALTLAPSMRAGWGEGQQGAPRTEYDPMRLGPNPPAPLVSLRSETAYAVLAACGVPTSMLRQSDGTGLREGWREFLHGSVQPIAKVISVELADKLVIPGLSLNFDALMASDLQGRARALQSMTGAGASLDSAAEAAGLPSLIAAPPAPNPQAT